MRDPHPLSSLPYTLCTNGTTGQPRASCNNWIGVRCRSFFHYHPHHTFYTQAVLLVNLKLVKVSCNDWIGAGCRAFITPYILNTYYTPTPATQGVVHTFHSLDRQIAAQTSGWKWRRTDCSLHCLPLHHFHGLVNALLTPLSIGARCHMMSGFNADHVSWNVLFLHSDVRYFFTFTSGLRLALNVYFTYIYIFDYKYIS